MNPRPTPNWRKWRFVPDVHLWEGVALSLNVEPESVVHGRMAGAHLFEESQEFHDRLLIATRNLFTRLHATALEPGDRPDCIVSLPAFAAWAISVEWEIPPELEKLAISEPDAKPEAKTAETPVGTRERTTLLIIIAALARRASIDVSQPFKAAEAIEALTAEMDVRVPARTIAEHLKRIGDALERRTGGS